MIKPILLTGASQRVGLELSKRLADSGSLIISASRTKPDLNHNNIIHFKVDLQNAEDRLRLINHIKNNYTGLRAIIHNASLWLGDNLDNLKSMYEIHIEAPYHLNSELTSLLENTEKSDIIHICDDSSSRGSRNHIAYAATKAALQNMTLSFAEKLAPKVRVNSISPGLLILKEASTTEYRLQTLKKAVLEYEPGADPLIDAVIYLLNTNYSTGSNIVVNGGRHLRKGNPND
jgi:dihydromonapterin reductase / dihydrofolate reductase